MDFVPFDPSAVIAIGTRRIDGTSTVPLLTVAVVAAGVWPVASAQASVAAASASGLIAL